MRTNCYHGYLGKSRFVNTSVITVVLTTIAYSGWTQEFMTGIEWTKPPIVDPGPVGGPPSDAVVLFDGRDLSAWENGENWLVKDGIATIGAGVIRTKQAFGDCQLHVEWSAPEEIQGDGQGRANSGIFLMDTYEIQILDSHENETYFDGQAGAIYKQTPPWVNAMRKPGQWNTYEIVFTGPRFNEDGSLTSPAVITAFHNGILILHHFELLGDTPFNGAPEYKQHAENMPISIQDHGNPVRFRNIWVREIKPIAGKRVRPAYIR